MKKSIFKGKSTHTKVFAVISAALIILLLCLNLLLTHVFGKNMIIVDLTPEGFYTMTDKMDEVCSELLDGEDEEGNKKQIKITFCCMPDYLTGNDHMRPTYFMALELQKRFDNVTVETVDVLRNPTAVSKYKTTSKQNFATTDMIVSYGAKYRIVNVMTFWFADDFSYNGEYRMASILASLTAVDRPTAYFLVGHGETYYDPNNPESDMSVATSALYDLLTECGLKIQLLDLSTAEAVPEDCTLLIINDPRADLKTEPDNYGSFGYVSEAEKLDRYLVNNAGAVIVNKGNDVELPIFESLLSEWGIGFSDNVVEDKKNEGLTPEGNRVIAGVYDTSENGVGGAYYGEYSALASAPQMMFTNAGFIYNVFEDSDAVAEPGSYNTSRIFNHFIGTSDSAIARDPVTGLMASGEGIKSLAVLSARDFLDGNTTENTFSYVFCTNSSSFFSNEILGNPAYANYAVMSTVISNISRTDRFASIELGGQSGNSPNIGGKQTVSTTLSEKDTDVYSPDRNEIIDTNKGLNSTARFFYALAAFVPPVLALAAGIVVFVRRRFL